MHIHILGICGTFMGGIAAIAKEAGHRVTGCDANVYPPMSTQLQALGIELIEGFSPDQLRLKADLWVIGNVVSRGNPLMEAILNAGQAYVSGPQWLAENVLRHKWVLAVAGTHGKTTTSSLLAWILDYAGLAPGFLIGGVPGNFDRSARLGGSDFFVIEADEYDTAFFDKRSKFVHYRPRTAVLNNLEFDHADIFKDVEAIETQFHHLVRTVPGLGRLIVNAHESTLARVLERGCWSELEHFESALGWHTDQHTDRLHEGEEVSEFNVKWGAEDFGVCRLALAGAHNRSNALAAIAAARHVGISPQVSCQALQQFLGIKRRLELRGTPGGVQVIDDFAHHPTAIATTIAGLKLRMQSSATPQGSSGRILAVLEPRSNTMKLGVVKAQLPGSLAQADLVFGYGGGLGWDLAECLAPLGPKAQVHLSIDALVEAIRAASQPGDRVLVMSNGGFGGVHQKLLNALDLKATPMAASEVQTLSHPRGDV
jgi:UDP-N-acetylmuramate: L-alanyl-gamma-D-glutamyl-meso-diaminopimelate ligase